jgi:dienelactone hydrolase
VIILHEILGITDTLLTFSRMIAGAGFRVYVPALFGSTKPAATMLSKAGRFARFLCIAHQFRVLAADQPGPWADWLRDLLGRVCDEEHTQAAGVIGLCLTGNFALSMAKDRRAAAPVMGEPSLPLFRQRALHVTADELAEVRRRMSDPADRLTVRGYRYATDKICGAAKFRVLKHELGEGFIGESVPAATTLHSVFTEHLRDETGALRHDKVAEVIAFLRERLGPAGAGTASLDE